MDIQDGLLLVRNGVTWGPYNMAENGWVTNCGYFTPIYCYLQPSQAANSPKTLQGGPKNPVINGVKTPYDWPNISGFSNWSYNHL